MATNDFIVDIVDKLREDNIEYLLVYVQKGKEEHHANAYYHISTSDGASLVGATIDEVYKEIDTDPSLWPEKDEETNNGNLDLDNEDLDPDNEDEESS
jgi:hypothetical protein